MSKSIMECIEQRRSIRVFLPDPIPMATLGKLVDAARMAPSEGNLEPWKFFVVLKSELRLELARVATGQEFLARAPALIVVCAEPSRSGGEFGERGETLYCIQDTAAAAQNILLAATGCGLGSCWITCFDEQSVSFVLGIPQHLRPVGMIALGYANETPEPPLRRPIDEVVQVIT